MAKFRTDKESTQIRRQYTWPFISGYGNNRHVRYYHIACYQTESDDHSPMWANKPSDMQNPPSGPPLITLGD